ncbi:MAG: ATP-binding protein [Psychrosphaera sp.]|nr:ATP-binding protein [Psychrosphaera sp.]
MITKLWIEDKSWNGYVVKNGDYLNLKKLNFFIGANNSGKSRFVRQVFEALTGMLHLNFSELQTYSFGQDLEYLMSYIKNTEASPCLEELTEYIALINKNTYSRSERNKIVTIASEIRGRRYTIGIYKETKTVSSAINNLERQENRDILEELFIPTFPNRYYLPILRGLRPIEPKNDSYKSRTTKDYFEDSKTANIVTGFELYELLTRSLLGEPEERARIKEYEEKLSDVFFDGQTLTLIPKYKNDTIAVKIGDEDQHSIYNLGDGLQQVIIVTSHAFLTPEPGLYFIEEPEAHMHPGLLRRLAIFLADETPHQYIMTTHSNHLFDLADDRDDIVINRVSKKVTDGAPTFEITEVSKDKSLLLELGVKPSSVYLANCTIWVEGVTDRFYIRAFLKRYLQILNESDSDDPSEGKKNLANFFGLQNRKRVFFAQTLPSSYRQYR